MKILVFTTDLPPISGHPTSGTALRTYNLSKGFEDLGHEVILSVPKSAINSFINSKEASLHSSLDNYKKLSFDSSNQATIISETRPDLILCGHWPAWTLGRKPDVPLIIDLAGPHLLEKYYQGDDDQTASVMGKLRSLSCADFFIVSGSKQRLYFMSFLLRANIPEPEKRIITVPMPMDKPLSNNKKSRDSQSNFPSFIFGGIFLPWQNPSWALGLLSDELLKYDSGNLTLIGGPHPHYDINSGNYEKLFKSLESNIRVKRLPLLPYEEFIDLLPNSDVAIDVMEWNLERELAITIRTTSYLWSGIPVIYNNYSDLSKLILDYDAGWCVAPGDDDCLKKIVSDIYNNPDLVKVKSANAIKLAIENFDRRKHAENIISLIESPRVISKELIDISVDTAENCDYPLSKYEVLTQKFYSRVNDFFRLEVLFALHGESTSDPVKITLRDIDTEKDIKCKIFSTSEIKNNEWINFQFDPIPNSSGRSYEIKIESTSKNIKSKIGPWVSGASPYPLNGMYYYSSKIGHNSICMKTYSKR